MPQKSDVRLTKRVVDALSADRDRVLFDAELKGFGVRVKPGGPKTFVIQFRNAKGRSRRVSLGQYGPLTVEQARARAKIELGRVMAGEDPALEREETRRALTVAALGEAYFASAERGEVRGKRGAPKKATTLRSDQYRWKRHVLPLIGSQKAHDLRRADIVDFLAKADKQAKEAGYAGGGERRLKGLLGGVFSWGVQRDIIEANPCAGVKVRPDRKRVVTMDAGAYRRLGRMLAEAELRAEPWQAIEAIRLVALAGCRRGEIAGLRWAEVDWDGQALRLGDTKTGASIRPLGKPACDALRALRARSAVDFVFPSDRKPREATAKAAPTARPFELPKAIGRIAGGLTGARGEAVTMHGLRYAFASTANGLGYTEATIAALIGHASNTITGRYTHALDAALIAAADRTAGEIAGWLAEGASEARGKAVEVVTATFRPDDENTALRALAKDPKTKALPLVDREALAKPLGMALGFWRAGLPTRGKRAKPEAWSLDALTRDCGLAFRHAGLKTGVWSDDRGDSPFLRFVDRLARAASEAPRLRSSLKSNGLRARRINRVA
jgi:integrase